MKHIRDLREKLIESWDGDRRYVWYFVMRFAAYFLFILSFILILIVLL